jgi:aminopeptidase C
LNDFITLCHYPTKTYYKKYELEHTSNIIGAPNEIFINLPIRELKKFCLESITHSFPIWFACDVKINHLVIFTLL